MRFCGFIDIPSPFAPTDELRSAVASIEAIPEQDDPQVTTALARVRRYLGEREAKRMEDGLREFTAKLARQAQIWERQLLDARRTVSAYSPEEQDAQNHAMETGAPLADPHLDAAARALRGAQDEWLRKVQSLGYLRDTIENYMGRIYSNYREWAPGQLTNLTPEQVDARNRMMAAMKRPLRGSGEFLKQRSFDTLQDAMAAGLQPVTHNWVDMQLLKLRSMQRFYEGTRYAETMKQTGMATWVPVEQTHSAEARGFQKLDDTIFQPRIRRDEEYGVREMGNWMAPEPAAACSTTICRAAYRRSLRPSNPM